MLDLFQQAETTTLPVSAPVEPGDTVDHADFTFAAGSKVLFVYKNRALIETPDQTLILAYCSELSKKPV
jgi:hypothetical protein